VQLVMDLQPQTLIEP